MRDGEWSSAQSDHSTFFRLSRSKNVLFAPRLFGPNAQTKLKELSSSSHQMIMDTMSTRSKRQMRSFLVILLLLVSSSSCDALHQNHPYLRGSQTKMGITSNEMRIASSEGAALERIEDRFAVPHVLLQESSRTLSLWYNFLGTFILLYAIYGVIFLISISQYYMSFDIEPFLWIGLKFMM